MEKIGLMNIRVSYENDETISTEARLSEIMKKLIDDTKTNDIVIEKIEQIDEILSEMFTIIDKNLDKMEVIANV